MKILFIHHSVGRNLLYKGNVREHLARSDAGLELWDHDYNKFGLSDNNGDKTGDMFPIPDDDTDVAGLEKLLDQAAADEGLMLKLSRYDWVVFKSCYPNSKIASAAQLEEFKDHYDAAATGSKTLGLSLAIVTTPPLRSSRTQKGEARRAHEMAAWLKNESKFEKCFDLFGRLANLDVNDPKFGCLAKKYQTRIPADSHPNSSACETVGPEFANFLAQLAD